jgi:hypothetical protein
MRALLLLVIASASCAPARPAISAGTTRYRAGDFVHYRYTGSFTPAPVDLHERVLAQKGDVLEIEVTIRRGAEQRQFVQVVTDTPENQKSNVVDELYVLEGGARRRLENQKNIDLFALYDWTFVIPDAEPTDRSDREVARTIGGVAYRCTAHAGRMKLRGRPLRFEQVDCPQFLWTHADGRFVDEETDEIVHEVEVVATGHAQGS